MNKNIFILSLFLSICAFSAKAKGVDMDIATPACFGTDFSNLTDSINKIIECLNIQTAGPDIAREEMAKRRDIINDYGASLYANATATRVNLDKEAKDGEKPQKSTNEREIKQNETQGQAKKIAERMDQIIKLESSIQVFETMLLINDQPYSEYGTGEKE